MTLKLGIRTFEATRDECSIEKRTKLHDSSNIIRTCITTISETAPPTCTLRVLSNREYSSVEYFTLVSAIRMSLIFEVLGMDCVVLVCQDRCYKFSKQGKNDDDI